MSEQNSIDARRALIIAQMASFECKYSDIGTNRGCIGLDEGCKCLSTARAIRESDEAAGYITARLETLESAKERRS
jgi:hypothetical protein